MGCSAPGSELVECVGVGGGGEFGFSAGDLTAIDANNIALHADIAASNAADALAQTKTQTKQTTVKNVKARHRALAQPAKKIPATPPLSASN